MIQRPETKEELLRNYQVNFGWL